MDIKILEKEMASTIGRSLREQFGRGPGNVHCSISDAFIVAYITDFVSKVELSLMSLQQSIYIEKTRDLLMETLNKEIKTFIGLNLDKEVSEFHYDWNLKAHTGMFLFVLKGDIANYTHPYGNRDGIHKEIEQISKEAEKAPDSIKSSMLNSRNLIIERLGILVSIEKELVALGFQENLRLAKRKLEKRLLEEHKGLMEIYLDTKIIDSFIVWNFENDKSYIVLVLKPKKVGNLKK